MGINNYYFNNIGGHLIDTDNNDFWLSSDNQGQLLNYATSNKDGCSNNFNIIEDGLVVWFDTNNNETTTNGNSLTSLNTWSGFTIQYGSGTTSNCGCFVPYKTNLSGITLCDIGLTGVDNGRYDSLSGLTLNLTDNNNKVILYPVTGYTINNDTLVTSKGKYDYPWSFKSNTVTPEGCVVGDTICLNGGFYQGYFKLDLEKPNPIPYTSSTINKCSTEISEEFSNVDPNALKYDLGPTNFDCGSANGGWSMETWVKRDTSDCGIISANTLNNNFSGNTGFFFYIGTRSENKFRNVFSGESGLYTCDDVIPLSPDDDTPVVTTDGRDWFTISNFGRNSCCSPCNNVNETTVTATTYCDQLSENALGFRIKPDGRIGYRKMTVSGYNYWCGESNNVGGSHFMVTGTTVEEGYSPNPIITSGNTWWHVVVTYTQNSVKHGLPAGTLKFWVNGRVVYRVEDFIGLKLRALNEWSSKQLGVPYNISWGGGSQGLLESQTFGGPDPSDQGLDIATNFAGTFEGEISQLRFYDKPLNLMEVRNNLYAECNRYCIKETYGGSLIKQPTITFCNEGCLKTNTIIYSVNRGIMLDVSLELSPGSIIAKYVAKSNTIVNEDLVVNFVSNINTISGNTITVNPTIVIPKNSDTGEVTITIDDDYNRIVSGHTFTNYTFTTEENLDVSFMDNSTKVTYTKPLPIVNIENVGDQIIDNNNSTQSGTTENNQTKIYYGKILESSFNINLLNQLTPEIKNSVINTYLSLDEKYGYGYILIPKTMTQPTLFRNSNQGCVGFSIPMLDMGEIILNINQEETIYIVYRTFVSTHSQVDVWLCE